MDDLRAMLLDFQQEQQQLLLNLQQSLHRFEEQLQAVTGQMNQFQLHTESCSHRGSQHAPPLHTPSRVDVDCLNLPTSCLTPLSGYLVPTPAGSSQQPCPALTLPPRGEGEGREEEYAFEEDDYSGDCEGGSYGEDVEVEDHDYGEDYDDYGEDYDDHGEDYDGHGEDYDGHGEDYDCGIFF